MVLIAVLIVITVLALAAYHFSDSMSSEYKGAMNAHKLVQVRALAQSGVHRAMAMLSNPEVMMELNYNVTDNDMAFRQITIPGDQSMGMISLIAPLDPTATVIRGNMVFGVTDEAAKLNINAILKSDPTGKSLHDMLMKLPNMSEDVADSIIDWVDPDDTPRAAGAESDYYNGLLPGYMAKNAPVESIEELLMIKGVTSQLLFGDDLNHNGIQDGNEQATAIDGSFDRGWSACVTVFSRELNVDNTGVQMPFINETDLTDLYTRLSAVDENFAKFVIMYRINGGVAAGSTMAKAEKAAADAAAAAAAQPTQPAQGGKGGKGGAGGGAKTPTPAPLPVMGELGSYMLPDLTMATAKKTVASMYDLMNSEIAIAGQGANAPTTIYTSPVVDIDTARTMMPTIMQTVGIFSDPEIPARINVNTASKEVLLTLPGLTPEQVDEIITARQSVLSDPTAPIAQSAIWLMTDAKVPAATMKTLEKLITGRSQVYRLQSVGYFENGLSSRIEAIIDTNAGRPRIIMARDMTDQGRTIIPNN